MKKYELVIDDIFPPLSPEQKQLKELINGRQPVDEKERKLVKQLEELKAKSQIPYIPSDI